MKRFLLSTAGIILLAGCSSFPTRQISFECDPQVNAGEQKVLVNVVFVSENDEALEQEIRKFEGEGPDAWFRKPNRQDDYVIQSLWVHPAASGRETWDLIITKEERRKLKGIAIIAEYGKRKKTIDSKGIIYLYKEMSPAPSPRKREYIYVGDGYMKRQRKTFWGRIKDI